MNHTCYKILRGNDGKAQIRKTRSEPLDILHHQDIVREAYDTFPEIPTPKHIYQYNNFEEVLDDPTLDIYALVFIDGGFTSRPIDLGCAVVVVDGGVVRHEIYCGVFCSGNATVVVSPTLKPEKRDSL
jgi:hypothetical protein